MKKVLLLAFGALLVVQVMAQQSQTAKSVLQRAGTIRSEVLPASIGSGNGGSNGVSALFDLRFDYDLSQRGVPAGGLAGCVFANRKFWVSKWNSDTIIVYSNRGVFESKFRIQGVTGVRAMTYDGQFIYAGQNTTTIAVIDPVNRTRVNNITVAPAVGNVRFISYNASADGGAGGFYVGNFNSAIFLISRTGIILETIDAGVHLQTGMYGLAYDTITPGGPFILVFCQTDNGQRMVRLNGVTGEPTGVSRNVLLDLTPNPGVAPLAGGMFIAPSINSGSTDTIPVIGGVLQADPNILFGYELGVFSQPAIEAELVSLTPFDEYVMKPRALNPVVNFNARVTNLGSTVFDTIYVATTLFDSDSLEISTVNRFATALRYPDSTTINTGQSLAGADEGRYIALSRLFLWNNTIDPTPANNSKFSQYFVTDTIYSRCFPSWNGALGIGGGGGFLGNKYNFPQRMVITSITSRFNAPTEGDSVYFQVLNMTGNNPGNTVLARTSSYIFTADDETNGVLLTLPFRNGPLTVTPRNVVVCAREHTANLTMNTNSENWVPNTSYVKIGAQAWQTTESANFRRTFLLFPNVKLPTDIDQQSAIDFHQVYPNPSSGQIFVNSTHDGSFVIRGISGQQLIKKSVTEGTNIISTNDLSSGMYIYELNTNGKKTVGKLVID